MRIKPTQTSFAPGDTPPSFQIETGRYRYFAVQVAAQAILLNEANAARRTQENFFDSWWGDDPQPRSARRPLRREVAGEPLEAPTGRATYTLPKVVWKRLQGNSQLYYRLLVSNDSSLKRPLASVADVDAARAPALTIASLPARPVSNPTARFRGKDVLKRPDLLAQAKKQMDRSGMLHGRDQDFRFAILDARYFNMTVLECHDWGLTDTVEKMPRKPDAIINGQFISSVTGIGTEGQVIREGALINADSQPNRYYVAEIWRGADIGDYHFGLGNPNKAEPQARAAFGGLGPMLLGSTPITKLTPWAKSIYDRSKNTGRGAIAVHRGLGLIVLLVQEDSAIWSANSMTMRDMVKLLQGYGCEDAVFNDGSDSESLYAAGGWQLKPGFAKNEAMDFAISFVDRRSNRRFRALVIDGTKTADGQKFADKIKRPPVTHYAPQNLRDDLKSVAALAPIATTFRAGVIEAWRTSNPTQANLIGQLVKGAGLGSLQADLLYISSHAWRHGQLWYHQNDDVKAPIRFIADPWSAGLRPAWTNRPLWVVIAGCAVLALHYSRGVKLDATERSHLRDWHQDMYGSGASVPGLTKSKETLFAVYHPGWAWYDRILRHSAVRGVLGYWYRSPGKEGDDVAIIEDFSQRLYNGEPFLNAWEIANRRGWFEAQAAWAAMIRAGCHGDTLATLEDATLSPAKGDFMYYDRYQTGTPILDAYRQANTLTDSAKVGSVTIKIQPDYDRLAIKELGDVSPTPTPANFLQYDDGIKP
jgi:hypothetical protein